ncbi:MAG: HNH endonuclease [Candidatus Eisenbacteria bacterium]|uniref:HNH endonuclease n=1 Tax=Eiseniibacteriota bacterium TaxID=2212470 RepID=A0A956NFW2_UNCEI|nr:HNH endonuclease [Candidatus Eisenbacteria bacterium]MCB9463675.1 HNH endonuclease [Candidatus Eisenbacteria bacterium]
MLGTTFEGNQTRVETGTESLTVSQIEHGDVTRQSTCQSNRRPSRVRPPMSGLTDDQLLLRADEVARTEHETGITLLDLLQEMDRRSVYLRLGYSSLFDFCTRRWLFSRTKAGRYIAVARATRQFPELRSLLTGRQITIGNVAQVVGILNDENAPTILAEVSGRTYREIEEIAARHRESKAIREVVRPVGVCGRKGLSDKTAAARPDLLGGIGASRTVDVAEGVGASETQCPNASRGQSDPRGAGSHVSKASESCAIAGTHVESRTNEGVHASTARCLGASINQTHPASNRPPALQAETRYEVRFGLRESAVRKLRRVQSLRSTSTSLEDLFEMLLDEHLERHDPKRRMERRAERKRREQGVTKPNAAGPPADDCAGSDPWRANNSAPSEPQNADDSLPSGPKHPDDTQPSRRSRHVAAETRDLVFERDGGRCTFVDPGGRRCNATRVLQIDHIQPYCLGGTHEPENLRLLCGRHNRAEAERLLGIRGSHRRRDSQRVPPAELAPQGTDSRRRDSAAGDVPPAEAAP